MPSETDDGQGEPAEFDEGGVELNSDELDGSIPNGRQPAIYLVPFFRRWQETFTSISIQESK